MNWYKRIGLALLGLLLLVFITGGVIAVFYGDKVKSYVVGEVNKQLNTKVEVGEIHFSVFKNFPKASVEFRNITAEEVSDRRPPQKLFTIGNLYLIFSIGDVISGKYNVKELKIRDAQLQLFVDENGKDNYHFWKESKDDSAEDVKFNLEKVSLQNVLLSYVDLQKKQDHVLTVDDAIFKGNFSSSKYDMALVAKGVARQLRSGDVSYAEKKNFDLDLNVKIDSDAGTYEFSKSSVVLANLNLYIDGIVRNKNDETYVDLEFKSENAGIGDILSLMPPATSEHFKEYSTKGTMSFSGIMKGDASGKKMPKTTVEFFVTDGYLRPADSPVAFENLKLKGSYSSNPERLELSSYEGKLGKGLVKGSLNVEDFANPFVDLRIEAKVDLNYLRNFLAIDTLKEMHGALDINASFSGFVKEIPDKGLTAFRKIAASGSLVVTDAGFRLKNNPLEFEDFTGKIILQDADLEVSGFKGRISQTDFMLTGLCKDLLLFFITPDHTAKIDANLVCNKVDLDQLLQNKDDGSSDGEYKLKFSSRIYADIGLSVADLKFRKFTAKQIRGRMFLKNQVLSAPMLKFMAMDGSVEMQGEINASKPGSVLISCESQFRALDIRKLFYELENFGQEVMVDKNLKGKVTADVQFASVWSPSLEVDLDKVYTKANITIENGELIDFEPMLALSKFVRLSELRNIKFSKLQNQIEIKKQLIYIPQMEIKSSALNLTASGTHSFDNDVDYHIRLLLSELLGKKVRDNKTEYGEIQDDGLGKTTIFIAMKGKADDPKFTWDKIGQQAKFQADIKTEKQNLKEVLNKEFGLFKKDTTLYKKSEPVKPKSGISIDYNDKETIDPKNESGKSTTKENRRDAINNLFRKKE